MKLHEALESSRIDTAFRPYYTIGSELRQKLVVSVGGAYNYTIWEDSKEYIADIQPHEQYKVENKDDWQPVKPI